MIDASTTPTSEKRSRLDPEPVARRDFLGIASVWSAAAALLFGAFGLLRLPKAAVLPSPSKKFKVSLPESLPPGEPYLMSGRNVAIFRDAEGAYAISTVCTHLGCIVKPTTAGFDCPCHGSQFDGAGGVTRGPAPKALAWLAVKSAGGGAIVVDEDATVAPGTKVPV